MTQQLLSCACVRRTCRSTLGLLEELPVFSTEILYPTLTVTDLQVDEQAVYVLAAFLNWTHNPPRSSLHQTNSDRPAG